MVKSTLFLPQLEVALQYWEETNSVSQMLFELSLENHPNLVDYEKPMIGSDLDEKRFLARSIKSFRNLRKCVESKIDFDPVQFLPRVPKLERERVDQVDFMRFDINRTISHYPYFLGSWLKYKKVYALPSPDIIKEVNPEKKNFFPFLPYGSFLIKFDIPMAIKFSNGVTLTYDILMFTLDKKDDIIDVLFLPTDLKSYFLDEKDMQLFLKQGKKSIEKVRFKKERGLLGISILAESGLIVSGISSKTVGEETHTTYTVVDLRQSYGPTDALYRFMRDKINGFCKLTSELSPRKFVLDESDEMPESALQKLREYEWDEVPITQIRNTKKLGGEIRIYGFHTGGEKSPHWRRGHWRSIQQDDGSFTRTWIEEMFIREDKLETENLQGSATRITDEE